MFLPPVNSAMTMPTKQPTISGNVAFTQPGDTPDSQHIDKLRLGVIEDFVSLLKSQARTRSYAGYITDMLSSLQQTILADTELLNKPGINPEAERLLNNIIDNCYSLQNGIWLLTTEHQKQALQDKSYLQDAIKGFNSAVEELSATTVVKELFERQSQVLENIILSHDDVSHWESFVLEILADFHSLFPFSFFFIAFSEEQH